MSLEYILLGMLREPASGYDLKTAFNEGARHFWSAELSQIYPTLQKMQKRGWVKSHREPSTKGPKRRIYRRTPKGTEQLHKWLLSGPQMGTERFAYIGQLIFMGEVADLERTREFLTALHQRLLEFYELLESVSKVMRQTHPDFPNDLTPVELHEYISLRIGVRSLKAKVAACGEGLELIHARLAKETSRV